MVTCMKTVDIRGINTGTKYNILVAYINLNTCTIYRC